MAAQLHSMLPTEGQCRRLLAAITDTGRGLFSAAACSITRLDEDEGVMSFEAASGEGAERIVGTSFAAGAGLAGWAIASLQPIVVDDVAADERHARDVAERSGYLPKAILAAPLIAGDEAIGALQVLDRDQDRWSSAQAVELLGHLAEQAAAALEIMIRIRRAHAVATGDSDLAALSHLASELPTDHRLAVLTSLENLLR